MRRKIGFTLLTLIVVFAALYFTFVYSHLLIPNRKQLPNQPELAAAIVNKVAQINSSGNTIYLATTKGTLLECGNTGMKTPLQSKLETWKFVHQNPYFLPQQGYKNEYAIAGKKIITGDFMQYEGSANGIFRIRNSDKVLTSFEIDSLYILEFNDMSNDAVTVIVHDFKEDKESIKIKLIRTNNNWSLQ